MAPERRISISGRFSQELVDRLDRIVEAMRKAAPGVDVKRSDALRAVVEAGLPSVEQTYGIATEQKGGKSARKPK